MSRPSSHEAYTLLERVRQRVNAHHWTTAETRAEQTGLEDELWQLEEWFLGREPGEVQVAQVAEAACATL